MPNLHLHQCTLCLHTAYVKKNKKKDSTGIFLTETVHLLVNTEKNLSHTNNNIEKNSKLNKHILNIFKTSIFLPTFYIHNWLPKKTD
jgi:hypothetical protein